MDADIPELVYPSRAPLPPIDRSRISTMNHWFYEAEHYFQEAHVTDTREQIQWAVDSAHPTIRERWSIAADVVEFNSWARFRTTLIQMEFVEYIEDAFRVFLPYEPAN